MVFLIAFDFWIGNSVARFFCLLCILFLICVKCLNFVAFLVLCFVYNLFSVGVCAGSVWLQCCFLFIYLVAVFMFIAYVIF